MRMVNMQGLSVRIADRQARFWDRIERGTWEALTLATVRAYCSSGVIYVDCGAWVGPTTLVAAGAGARVVAIEADPVAAAQLAANLEANPELARQVTVVRRALSRGKGRVPMGSRREPGSSMSSTLFADAEAQWQADALTPAELMEMVDAACPLVTKIDIEGGEYDLVPTLVPWIERQQSAVQLSLHPKMLAEVRGADEVSRATLRILRAFAGWTAYCANEGDWSPIRDPLSEGLTQAVERATDWLFVKGWDLRTRRS